MARSRRKEALIGGGVSLAFVLLAIIVVLHQSPDSPPILASNTPVGTVAPQVLGTVFTIPSASPDPAESSVLAPVETELVTSTITALSTVIISGKPVVQTAFRTTTATSRVTLPPVVKAGPTVLSTRTFLATITQAGVVTVTTQTATATETLPAVTNTATQTQTATVTHTSISPGPTTTIISPGPTVTHISVSPGPTTTIVSVSPGPTTTIISPGPTPPTPAPSTIIECIDSVTQLEVDCPAGP
jgi:hypothetical protein